MTFTETIFLYTSILFFCLFFAKEADANNNKNKIIPIIVILSLLAGLRHYSVGIDTKPYMLSIENFFKLGRHVWPYTSFSKFYGYFTIFIYKIYHNYNFLLFIEAAIINSLIVTRFWDFRKDSSFVFIIFVYLIVIYLRTFNLNVQYLSLSILFFATRYLNRNKDKLFFILVGLASLLHTSALIGILYYIIKWLNFKNITKNQFMIKIITMLVGIITSYKIYSIMYSRYSQYLYSNSKMGMMVFAQLFVFIATKMLYKKVVMNNTINKEQAKNVFTYYLIGILLSFSSYFVPNAGRISYYFMIFEPVFYGYFIKNAKVDKIYKLLIVLWFIIYAVYVIIDGLSATGYFPYRFCFI